MEHPAYDAVFFDLDGTLLPMELDEFLSKYFTLLGSYSAACGFDPQAFSHAVSDAVRSMCTTDLDDRTTLNSQVFWSKLEEHLGAIDDDTRRHFDLFYANDFGRIGEGLVPNPAAARAVDALRAKGYPLYLTTMPLFPRSGVEWRVRWAGVDPAAFSRITCYDNSTACKPHLDYYRENLQIAQVSPSRVLMVGNNTKEDLACLETGMDAYLVTDFLINPNEFDVATVKHGSLSDFADFAESLPACTSTVAAQGNPNRVPATVASSAPADASSCQSAYSAHDAEDHS